MSTRFPIKCECSCSALNCDEDEAKASSLKVEELPGSIATGEKYLADATTIGKKDASDFAATETELDMIDTL